MDKRMLVAHVSFARGLAEPILDNLADLAQERRFERGAMITLEGEPADAMYVVADGRVKIVRHSHEGREQILHIAEQFDHFNTVPIFGGGSCPATTEALVPTGLLVLPRDHQTAAAWEQMLASGLHY